MGDSDNLTFLKDDMVNKEWSIFDFIIDYLKQGFQPILFLFLVFLFTVVIRLVREEWRNKYFNENEFGKKYILAHGMACGFALIYSCVLYFVSDSGSYVVSLIMLVLFYGFLLKIITTENQQNGGYIENLDGASGAIMYITSVLSPVVFVGVHLLLGEICLLIYKSNDDYVWKTRAIKRIIECGEAFIASLVIKVVATDTFVDVLWLNSIMIAVFTLIIPSINDFIYAKLSLD